MNCEGFQGISFGVMDAVVTVLGVMIGLSVIDNRFVLVIGILTAGVADSFANAAGMHVAQETEIHHEEREVFKSTIFCFFATLITVLILTLPIIFIQLPYSIYFSAGIGFVLLVSLGYFVSKINKKFKPYKLAVEYLIIGISVGIICYIIGSFADVIIPNV
jgi:VIT1/CCC1 family predicted Fe2+/Mn2+ transporter